MFLDNSQLGTGFIQQPERSVSKRGVRCTVVRTFAVPPGLCSLGILRITFQFQFRISTHSFVIPLGETRVGTWFWLDTHRGVCLWRTMFLFVCFCFLHGSCYSENDRDPAPSPYIHSSKGKLDCSVEILLVSETGALVYQQ